jgi:hypothetical protein
MPPKHRQIRAPRLRASGNAFQALVDPPHDGNNLSFDGGDERTDGSDDNTVVNARPRDSGPPASPQHYLVHQQTDSASVDDSALALYEWAKASLEEMSTLFYKSQAYQFEALDRLFQTSATIEQNANRTEAALQAANENDDHRFTTLNNTMAVMLQKMDAAWTENTALREAYRASREETAALKAAVDALTQKLDESIAISAPPSPETATTSTAMEEMTMQLSHVQNDIQDVLDAVRNPPGKRKRRTSGQDNEPTTPTNGRPATQRQRDASPEHSLIHSRHATSAAQEALDALMIKYPPRQLAIASTSANSTPSPASPETQDTPLPDAPATAPVETEGWKTVEGKAIQRKKKNEEADKKRAKEMNNKPPMTKNGGRGKNSHQPQPNTTSTKKTWADVIKSGGINVQIVLGNGNLGLTTPMKARGERRGGAARRLGRRNESGERGATEKGNNGPELNTSGGNKGGKIGKNGRGRVEEGEEPGVD